MLRAFDRRALRITGAAAGILLLTMGVRQSFGLFIAPLQATSGIAVARISLALAIGQFAWGAIQPLAGMLAERYGTRPVLVAGIVLLAAGCALTPYLHDAFALTLALGLMASIGSGMGSFSVLIGTVASRLPLAARGAAAGIINAGGSLGQFIFAPLADGLIQRCGGLWAWWAMALSALAALPLVGRLNPAQPPPSAPAEAAATSGAGAWQSMRTALRDPGYLLLGLGFFTCGFHVAFLSTHLPGAVALCGLPPAVASWSLAIIGLANIFGSLAAGAGVARYRCKHILAVLYATRAVLIGLYLLLPPSALLYYLLAAGLGFTWLATVPPTSALIGKLFGVRHLSTLFGLALLAHQTGGFLGAWLGGLCRDALGDFTAMWYADLLLALLAALINLPIREAPVTASRNA